MDTSKFNYSDYLQSSAYTQFIADQHDQAIQTNGRKTYVFLLDKKDTELSEVYKEEKHGRIYLPHFEQRALYKTNPFTIQLNAQNYIEKEENLELEFDFGRMVHNIHELKSKTSGVLVLENTSKIPLEIEISDSLIIRKNIEILFTKKIGGNIYTFINEVNNSTNLINLTYSGDSEQLDFLDKMSIKILPRRKTEINLNNSIYKNTDDVISAGAVIVTDRNRLYQVTAVYPKNDSYGRYISWNAQLQLMNLAKADGLPNDYAEIIKANQYGLTSKYDL